MTETVDDRTIINNALRRIGAAPIGALDEDTDLANQVVAVYRDRVDALLALYEWPFAAKTYALAQIAETTGNGYDATAKKFLTGWRHAFALPGDRLALPWRVLADPRQPDNPLRDFAIEQDILYSDHKPLWATVPVRAAPQVWPPAFRLAATVLCAADLCVPVTHDAKLAAELRQEGEGSPADGGRGGLIGKTIALMHASARRKAPQWSDPLTSARWM